MGAAQKVHQSANDPVHMFLSLIGTALVSGDAHVAATDGGSPEHAGQWGWRREMGITYFPRGTRIGWVDDTHLYLHPEAAVQVATQTARKGQVTFAISTTMLGKRLVEKGLATREGKREANTVRKIIEGRNVAVLRLDVNCLDEPNLTLMSGACKNLTGDLTSEEAGNVVQANSLQLQKHAMLEMLDSKVKDKDILTYAHSREEYI
jgi:hypothetical protein